MTRSLNEFFNRFEMYCFSFNFDDDFKQVVISYFVDDGFNRAENKFLCEVFLKYYIQCICRLMCYIFIFSFNYDFNQSIEWRIFEFLTLNKFLSIKSNPNALLLSVIIMDDRVGSFAQSLDLYHVFYLTDHLLG